MSAFRAAGHRLVLFAASFSNRLSNRPLHHEGGSQNAEPPEIISIHPGRIKFFLDDEGFRKLRRDIESGVVVPHTKITRVRRKDLLPLTQVDSVSAFLNHLSEKEDFSSSPYHRRVEQQFNRGIKKGGHQSFDEWVRKNLEPYLALQESIESSGFHSPEAYDSTDATIAGLVTVYQMDGSTFALVDGKHRLVVSLALGIATIPVYVIARA